MPVLTSQLNPRSDSFKASAEWMRGLVDDLNRQLARIAQGGNPRPGESGLAAFLKSLLKSQWGTYRTRRMRA